MGILDGRDHDNLDAFSSPVYTISGVEMGAHRRRSQAFYPPQISTAATSIRAQTKQPIIANVSLVFSLIASLLILVGFL